AVEVLPGPSAAFGLAVLSGFPLRRFSFEGFPPRAAGARREAFARALREGATSLWYESPQRIRSTLAGLAELAADAEVFLVREYTKMHEQQALGGPAAVAAQLAEPVRGEIAFAIAPYCAPAVATSRPADDAIDAAIDALLAERCRIGEIAKRLTREGLGERSDLYARASARKAAGKGGATFAERA
ncbi:MAG: SAM-dependent methyltransferase, partial [Candidatus Tumulicola sp.]